MSISRCPKTKPLLAWMLYCSILLSAWLCATGHGQMAGMQLSGLDSEFCSLHDNGGASDLSDHSSMLMASSMGDGCALSSLFSAVLLAALFGLLALLAGESARPLPPLHARRSPRDRWPLANPRASPQVLLSL
ncbi:DUF2946 family protein [Pseudomonas sp. 5P_3.1_Bac2]|uniref:DUF2946 family protein n=1 Tax=Pseudomonas sp. 5P_3.1_Bac2 TaxID=2971617 RepID=UPI0021C69B14|nr:DUF2946 family protein [Pseudomonas sp. 5P_3.1_Bac2]MCU1717737.1 DUF2946 family protein [Pseudomonas sp. 5P_3.1_Bac2]